MAGSIGPAKFAAQHHAWFRLARDVAPPTQPLLHVYSEDLTSAMAVCNATMARVYRFLDLPPLPDNCDISKVPLEWPCDIQKDSNCSLEKYAPASGIAGAARVEKMND